MLATHSLSSIPSSSSSYSPTLQFPPKSILPNKSSFHGIRLTPFNPSSFLKLRAQQPPSTVVMMAKKEEELNEIRTKTTDEINEEILQLKGELFMLRLQRSAREDFKPSEFGRMRKRVCLIFLISWIFNHFFFNGIILNCFFIWVLRVLSFTMLQCMHEWKFWNFL